MITPCVFLLLGISSVDQPRAHSKSFEGSKLIWGEEGLFHWFKKDKYEKMDGGKTNRENGNSHGREREGRGGD